MLYTVLKLVLGVAKYLLPDIITHTQRNVPLYFFRVAWAKVHEDATRYSGMPVLVDLFV